MSDQPRCPCSICDDDYAESVNTGGDLRTRIATIVTQMSNQPCCDSPIHAAEPSGWPLDVADAVIELLIDMAGHGELLKAIDGLHRTPRSAEKLGLTGDGA